MQVDPVLDMMLQPVRLTLFEPCGRVAGLLSSVASARRQYWCNWVPPAIAALDSGGAGRPMTCEKNCGAAAIATVTLTQSVCPSGQVWLFNAVTVTPLLPSTWPYWAATAFA